MVRGVASAQGSGWWGEPALMGEDGRGWQEAAANPDF